MTASRLDLHARARLLIAPLAITLLTACRGGLPPEPPGADPTDPDAAIVPYQVQANPYEVSAFAGEQPAKTDPHAGHGNMNHGAEVDPHAGHGQMDHGSNAGAPAAPTGHEQMGHGNSSGGKQSPKPTAPTGHENMNHGSGTGSKPAPAPAPSPGHTGHKQAEQPR